MGWDKTRRVSLRAADVVAIEQRALGMKFERDRVVAYLRREVTTPNDLSFEEQQILRAYADAIAAGRHDGGP